MASLRIWKSWQDARSMPASARQGVGRAVQCKAPRNSPQGRTGYDPEMDRRRGHRIRLGEPILDLYPSNLKARSIAAFLRAVPLAIWAAGFGVVLVVLFG